jgi:elongation factor G
MVRVQGPVHLRRLKETLEGVFGVSVEDEGPGDAWLETIAKPAELRHRHRKQTGGAGQFAEVAVRVEPNGRGEGFSFDQQVKGGAVPRQFFGAVEAGARDATAKGPLGHPVTDVHVVLLDGRAHSVDSSDFAFRTAARVAVEQALAEAAPVRLQPVYAVTIRTPSVFGGGLSPTIAALKGQVRSFERDPSARGWDLFHALLPGASLPRLPQALRAETQGVAWFEAAFDHYEEVHGKAAERGEALAG